MNIIDFIVNLFPAKKNRFEIKTDKFVNLITPAGASAVLSGGGTATDTNPTGTGGQQGQTVGVDGLTAIERNKIKNLKTYNDKLALYKILAADYNKKFNEKTETVQTMATLKTALLNLKKEVALALLNIKQYDEYLAAKMNFEAVPETIGAYKVKSIV